MVQLISKTGGNTLRNILVWVTWLLSAALVALATLFCGLFWYSFLFNSGPRSDEFDPDLIYYLNQ